MTAHRADGGRVAALFVAADGVYANRDDVDAWPLARDARTYAGPWPVVAHPPCQRWGRYWHGSPRKPHQYAKGDDGGCFTAALGAVRFWGGLLEHPAYSHAWLAHGLPWPRVAGGWHSDIHGGWCCHVEQGWYGNASRKPTWLYAAGVSVLPELRWGAGEQRIDARLLERRGYEYARRCGIVGLAGGKRKQELRAATPPEFAELLIAIARTARGAGAVAA